MLNSEIGENEDDAMISGEWDESGGDWSGWNWRKE